MTTLYNLRSDGEQYRITKFVDDEVQGSYLVTHENCDCPAGHRHTCRHRQMLPNLLSIIDTQWFWDFDRHTVVDLMGTPKPTAVPEGLHDTAEGLPPGVQMISLDGDPATLWNTIADAVGEPRSPVRTPLPPAKWRRL